MSAETDHPAAPLAWNPRQFRADMVRFAYNALFSLDLYLAKGDSAHRLRREDLRRIREYQALLTDAIREARIEPVDARLRFRVVRGGRGDD